MFPPDRVISRLVTSIKGGKFYQYNNRCMARDFILTIVLQFY